MIVLHLLGTYQLMYFPTWLHEWRVFCCFGWQPCKYSWELIFLSSIPLVGHWWRKDMKPS